MVLTHYAKLTPYFGVKLEGVITTPGMMLCMRTLDLVLLLHLVLL